MTSEDPRGSLPQSSIQTITASRMQPNRRSLLDLARPRTKHVRHRKPPCYDWIFSSGSNIHVAVDKFWFKSFTSFDTHVLTVSGQEAISVRGIGSVELKIRCKPNSHSSRAITLENVLYIPGWACNIFSDKYFDTNLEEDSYFEHKWNSHGICFTKKTSGKIKPWGYTESFRGLDRLVLSRKPQGRSPMLEDTEREVWSINVNWPQSQQDKWKSFSEAEIQRLTKEHEEQMTIQQHKADKAPFTESTELLLPKHSASVRHKGLPTSMSKGSIRSRSEGNLAKVMARQVSAAGHDLHHAGARMSLCELSNNRTITVKNDTEGKVNSLKATFNANRGMLKDFLSSQNKENEV